MKASSETQKVRSQKTDVPNPLPAGMSSEEDWHNFRQLIQDYHETIEKFEHLASQVAEDHFSATSRTRYVSTGFNSNVDGWTVAITIKCDRNNKP